MTLIDRLRRFSSSPVFSFLFFSLFFGTLAKAITVNSSLSWIIAVAVGLLFGLAMTAFAIWNKKRFCKTIGLADPSKLYMLQRTLTTGKIPDDPDALKALPAYLQKILPLTKGVGRTYLLIAVLFNVFQLTSAIATGKIKTALIITIFSCWIFLCYMLVRRANAKIDKLYAQLQITPEPFVKKPSLFKRNRQAVIVLSALAILVLIALAGAVPYQTVPIKSSTKVKQSTPTSNSPAPSQPSSDSSTIPVENAPQYPAMTVDPAPSQPPVVVGPPPDNSKVTGSVGGNNATNNNATVVPQRSSDTNNPASQQMYYGTDPVVNYTADQ